jgi:N-acetylglucosaminyldiphosphoundecaprenol N-acetyl-beta-D-mannosaminyltransferase
MSLVWYLRRRGHKHVGRVYGPDLMSAMCQRSMDRGHRVCFYGGSEQTLDALKTRLLERFPFLQIASAIAPPFRPLTPGEQAEIVQRINDSRPDIVWVGIGSPRQERWIAEHRDKIGAAVMIGVGAAFDFLSGTKAQAPRWIQRSGLEWLFRLASEPRRLWRRYAEYPLFLALLLAQWTGIKRFALED